MTDDTNIRIRATLASDVETSEQANAGAAAELGIVIFDASSKKYSDVLSANKILKHPALMEYNKKGIYAFCFASDEMLVPSIIGNTIDLQSHRSPALSRMVNLLSNTSWCLPKNKFAEVVSSTNAVATTREYALHTLPRAQRRVASVDDIISIARASNRSVEVVPIHNPYDDVAASSRRLSMNRYVEETLAMFAAVLGAAANVPGLLPEGGVLIARASIPSVYLADGDASTVSTSYSTTDSSRYAGRLPVAPLRAVINNNVEDTFPLGVSGQSVHRVPLDPDETRVTQGVLDVVDSVYVNACVTGIAINIVRYFVNELDRGSFVTTNPNEHLLTPMTCSDPCLLDWFLHVLLGEAYNVATNELQRVMGRSSRERSIAELLEYPAALDYEMFQPDALLGLAASRTLETNRTRDITDALHIFDQVLFDACKIRNVAYKSYRYFPKRLEHPRVSEVRKMLLEHGGWQRTYARGVAALRALGHRIHAMDELANVDQLLGIYATSGLDVDDILGGMGENNDSAAHRRIRP